jgi:hypothetical protein
VHDASKTRKDTPVPPRRPTADAQPHVQVQEQQALPPPKASAGTMRKFATPAKGVQFAKGYTENGVRLSLILPHPCVTSLFGSPPHVDR